MCQKHLTNTASRYESQLNANLKYEIQYRIQVWTSKRNGI